MGLSDMLLPGIKLAEAAQEQGVGMPQDGEAADIICVGLTAVGWLCLELHCFREQQKHGWHIDKPVHASTPLLEHTRQNVLMTTRQQLVAEHALLT